MFKLLSTFLSASVIFILSYFFSPEQGPMVTVEAPAKIRPGETAEVKLTVNKGSMAGFARLQVFLPEGLTADGGSLHNAQFLHEDNFVKFIWIDLPADSVYTVSLYLHVSAEARGTKYLNGFFSYLEEEISRKITFAETAIEIDPNASALADNRPQVERRIVATAPEQGEYRVELDIRPNSRQQAARFVDQLPADFTATAIDARGALFSQESGDVIFRWTELPTDSVFTVSYAVKGPIEAGAPAITGMLVFGTEAIDASDPESTASLDTGDAEQIIQELISSEQEKLAAPMASAKSTTIAMPAPQGGLYFTVQVAATNRSPKRDNAWFASRYRFDQQVSLTEHDGWNKYLIGQCATYEEAKSLRDRTRSAVNDAFIVAYDENGQRIPVGQALAGKPLNQ